MVKVCDAIMGSGKTSAAISYINSHPEKHFLYITPYLDEAKRIKKNCKKAGFVEPNNFSEESHSKVSHTLSLLLEGRNIVSTHQAATLYDEDILEALKEKDYCIIIDEAINIIQAVNTIDAEDIKLFSEFGYLEEVSPNEFKRTNKPYTGKSLWHTFRDMGSKTLTIVTPEQENGNDVYYFIFSKDFLSLPNEIILLTYLFKGSPMQLLMQINDIPYDDMYINKTDEGFAFSDSGKYIPEYTKELGSKINILQLDRMNEIGNNKHALSIHWYDTHSAGVEQLQKNIYNYFVNLHRNCGAGRFMCGSYKKHWGKIKGKGYSRSMTVFNERATNKYSDRDILAYPVNIFCNPSVKRYFANRGVTLDDDNYALSIMIQWIWRSAIRNGANIDLYIPSDRMRTLLSNWINDTCRGGETIG